jgi:hypothetical protein
LDRQGFSSYVKGYARQEFSMSVIRLFNDPICEPGQPLWQRVPTRDADGRTLYDFMMLIHKLGRWPEARRQGVFRELHLVFNHFDDHVVFADLNLRLNLLWVSMRPHPDGCLSIAGAVKERIPEAVLVASRAEAMAGATSAARRRWWQPLLR